MKYLGTAQMDCSDCGNHLDVPIYCGEDKATHGYNYCPICAARLFGQGVDYKSELIASRRKCEELALKLIERELER